jgi:hypothetical protein
MHLQIIEIELFILLFTAYLCGKIFPLGNDTFPSGK